MTFRSLAKSSLFTIFALLVFVLLHPADSHALCFQPPTSLIAVCENNSCKEGFAIQYHGIGDGCDTRPVVVESGEIEDTFSFVLQKLHTGTLTGTYELKTHGWCPQNRKDEYCLSGASIEKLSDSTNVAQLNTLKSEWRDRERGALRSATTQKWLDALILVAIVVFAIIWPWILMKIWVSLRRRIFGLLVIAILLQLPLTLILLLFAEILSSTRSLWVFLASIVVGLSVLGEVIYLIVRKIKTSKVSI